LFFNFYKGQGELNEEGSDKAYENAHPLGTNISYVRQFYDLGARYMSF
jgi:microsomal dipeptidase-like Zn-dependent dipeptidase